MSFIKPKTIVVGTAIGMLLLGTGVFKIFLALIFQSTTTMMQNKLNLRVMVLLPLKKFLTVLLKKFLLYQL